jgi:Cu-Zn family superoxide dismutase
MKYMTLLILITLVSCSSKKKEEMITHDVQAKAESQMHSSARKNLKGIITIEDLKDEIKVTADVSGLKPNQRLGFHIHENGVCQGPDYKTAGDHLNPYGQPHGDPNGKIRHLGDMGNLESNANGEAKKVILLPKSQMDDLNMLIGKSIIIHSKADDMKTQPTGDAGDRVACGLIEAVDTI